MNVQTKVSKEFTKKTDIEKNKVLKAYQNCYLTSFNNHLQHTILKQQKLPNLVTHHSAHLRSRALGRWACAQARPDGQRRKCACTPAHSSRTRARCTPSAEKTIQINDKHNNFMGKHDRTT